MTPEPSAAQSTAERSLALDAALTRRAALTGWSISSLVHVAVIALVYASGEVPDYGFEFTAPAELELGMTDVVEVEAVSPPAPPVPAEAPPAASGLGEGAMDAGVPAYDGSFADVGVPTDAARRRRRDAAVSPDAAELLASGGDDARPPVAFLPAGGQIALRLDLDRVRTSPVREDVETLLAAIPDWQAILGTSGVDPVRDLSRVLLATPNLQRSSIVVAGRLATDADGPDAIVERMITAAGGTVAWEEIDGARSSDWPNPDATPRRVAIVGDRHFVIARAEDLPRVLAIAAARAERVHEEEPDEVAITPADALLALPDGAAMTLEVEGARAYVRQSPCTVPTRLSARIDEREGDVEVSLHGIFDDADESAESAACFDTLRVRALGNPFVSFAGMAGPLGALEITTDEETLDARTHLSYGQVQRLLRYVQAMFHRSTRTAPTTAGTTGPAAVTPVPPPPVAPPVTPVAPPVIPVPPPPPPT